jgi:hypothetical protein
MIYCNVTDIKLRKEMFDFACEHFPLRVHSNRDRWENPIAFPIFYYGTFQGARRSFCHFSIGVYPFEKVWKEIPPEGFLTAVKLLML